MPTATLALGADLQVTVLCDAAGSFPEPLEDAFPELGASGPWLPHVHCMLVRAGDRLILVDTGIGPDWAPAGEWFSRPGRLPSELGAAGVSAEEITDVVITHLDPDHLGWAVIGEDDPKPHFPNARYVVQAAELAALKDRGEEFAELAESHVKPLADAGLLDEKDGPVRLADRIDLVLSPGHTAAHQCVLVDAPDRPLLITGDAFVHPGQIADTSLSYHYDADSAVATETRTRLLSVAAKRGVLLAPTHLAEGILLVEGDPDTGFSFRPIARCQSALG